MEDATLDGEGFYEGDDDVNYYESRISVFIGSNTSFPFKCKGKKNVLFNVYK